MNKIQRPPLTPEQQKLVEQNHNLIYSFAMLRGANVDEAYGALATGLCLAARSYSPEKNVSFSTYAYRVMRNELVREWRDSRVRSIPDELVFSYDATMPGDDHGHESSYLDKMDDISMVTRLDTSAVEIREFIDTLSEHERDALDALFNSRTASDAADKLHISKQRISWIRQKLGRKWHEFAAKPINKSKPMERQCEKFCVA